MNVFPEHVILEIEDMVAAIMDDLVDGNDIEDVMENTDRILEIIGSDKTSEDLISY